MKRIINFLAANKLLAFVLALLCVVHLVLLLVYPQSARHTSVISWDTFGYYLYLPASFIYHDLFQLRFAEAIMHQYHLSEYFYAARPGPIGNYVMNYPLGAAILYFPFFCIGHLVALVFHYPPDGFSPPYQYSIFAGGVVYSLAGVVVTMRNLRFFFSQKITALLIVILVGGTNYLHYTFIENAMTHSYLFTVGACVIYYSIKWHKQQHLRYAVYLGLLTGLAVVIRPTEIFWCLIPLLWGVYSVASAKEKFALVISRLPQLLCLLLAAFAVGCIQMIYWKAASGKFIYYSYDGFFNFLHPHILDGLISWEKGWLVYTPLMALALVGLPVLWFKKRELFVVCTVYSVIVVYVTFSWEAWQYGGGFGARPMVQSYALLLLPMGVLLSALSRYVLRFLLLPVVAFCVFLNCFQTWQYAHEFFDHEGLNRYKYGVIFLRTHLSKQIIRDYFDLKQPPTEKNSMAVYADTSSVYTITTTTGQIIFDSIIQTGNHTWLKINGKAMFEPFQDNFNKFSHLQVTIQPTDKNAEPEENILPLQPLIGNNSITWERDLLGVPNVWDDVFIYLPTATNSRVNLRVALRNPSGNNLHFKNLQVSLWGQ